MSKAVASSNVFLSPLLTRMPKIGTARMWRIPTTIIALLPIGCADASERTFDSANPVRSLVVFGIAANGAKQVSKPEIADEMVRRSTFLAEQHGGLAWINKITPQSMEIGKKMEAAHDERATLRLLDECVAQQNADPSISARKKKQ
jgi:hypothetical protein